MTNATNTRTVFRAEGFSCPSCVTKIEKQVGKLDGINDVSVKFASGRVQVDHDPNVISAQDVASVITRTGYPATVSAF